MKSGCVACSWICLQRAETIRTLYIQPGRCGSALSTLLRSTRCPQWRVYRETLEAHRSNIGTRMHHEGRNIDVTLGVPLLDAETGSPVITITLHEWDSMAWLVWTIRRTTLPLAYRPMTRCCLARYFDSSVF